MKQVQDTAGKPLGVWSRIAITGLVMLVFGGGLALSTPPTDEKGALQPGDLAQVVTLSTAIESQAQNRSNGDPNAVAGRLCTLPGDTRVVIQAWKGEFAEVTVISMRRPRDSQCNWSRTVMVPRVMLKRPKPTRAPTFD